MYFHENVYPPQIDKKINAELGYKIYYGPYFKLFWFPDPALKFRDILLKREWDNLLTKNRSHQHKAILLPQIISKIAI